MHPDRNRPNAVGPEQAAASEERQRAGEVMAVGVGIGIGSRAGCGRRMRPLVPKTGAIAVPKTSENQQQP
jgi:hypothetical protein